jgi:hypothetical protein
VPTHITHPSRVPAAGSKSKIIDEFVGRVNTDTDVLSIAHMNSPSGWIEPGQTPEFDEFTLVLRGTLRVDHRHGAIEVNAGEAVIVHRGEWVFRRLRRSWCTETADGTPSHFRASRMLWTYDAVRPTRTDSHGHLRRKPSGLH